MDQRLRDLFNNCFAGDFRVKPCGREACINLIEAMQRSLCGAYGNAETGFMDIDAIRTVFS